MSARDLGTLILLGAGFPLAWTSVALHLRTPWRDTELGRHLLVYSLALAIVLSFGVLSRLTGGADWVEYLRAPSYAVLAGTLAWRVALQVRFARA